MPQEQEPTGAWAGGRSKTSGAPPRFCSERNAGTTALMLRNTRERGTHMDASLLYQSVCDQLKELQIKLGYAYESTRFYYKVTSINALTGTTAADVHELCRQLHAGHALEDTPLGKVTFGSHEDRLEVRVPPTGAQYVHEQLPEPAFLTALIELFLSNHHATKEQILALFKSFSPEYVVEQVPEGFGFDFSVHFEDPAVDPYFYCFTNETGHIIYHRFLEADYRTMFE